MMIFLVVPLIRALPLIRAADICVRYECSSCPSVIDLSRILYDGCQSSSAGGAIMIADRNSVLNLTNCEFWHCQAPTGGCVCANAFAAFLAFQLKVTECQASSTSSCFVNIYPTDQTALQVNETAITAGTCVYDSFSCKSSSSASMSPPLFRYFNSTGNEATDFASSLSVDQLTAPTLFFVLLCSNYPSSTLNFGMFVDGDCELTCIEFRNNTAHSSSFPGLIDHRVGCDFIDCVFTSNNIDYVANRRGAATVSVTFLRCVFTNTPFVNTRESEVINQSCELLTDGNAQLNPFACSPGTASPATTIPAAPSPRTTRRMTEAHSPYPTIASATRVTLTRGFVFSCILLPILGGITSAIFLTCIYLAYSRRGCPGSRPRRGAALNEPAANQSLRAQGPDGFEVEEQHIPPHERL
jgi:hypothetical protein